MKKISKWKMAKYLMLAAAIGFLMALWLIPVLKPLKGDIWVWLLFGIYVLITAFVWALDHKSRHHFELSHKDDVGKMEETELEGLREQLKWRFTKF
ncbi:MAG: hypothetical protein ACLSX5_01770 [Lachnospiraceae bacterium]